MKELLNVIECLIYSENDLKKKKNLKLPLGVLTEGPHAIRLDCAVNLNRLFNERFSFGNMSPVAFNKLLLAAGVALTQEDSQSVQQHELFFILFFKYICLYLDRFLFL
jgi:hypothetical protein